METEKYQKELFEFESPKRAAARFGGVFPRTDFAIILTPEKMVFAAIGVIMLMVIFFALGVEKGRSAAHAKLRATKTTIRNAIKAPETPAKLAPVPITITRGIASTNITLRVNPAAMAAKAPDAFDKTRPYMIVTAAFSREGFALKEVGKLKAAGLDAFVYYGEPYYLSCIGSFQSKAAAQKILNKVKQMHRDAYVRLR